MNLAALPATHRTRGFTAAELLVCLAIVAILAAVAGPSFRDYLGDRRVAAAMAQLVGDLNYARTEAIKRNTRVLLCARSAAGSGCGGSADWQNGWVVCYDANSDDICDTALAGDPNPMKVGNPLPDQLRLAGTTSLIRFNAIGSSGGAATLTLSGTSSSRSRTGTVAANGSISTRKN